MALTAVVGTSGKMKLNGTRFEFLRESVAMRQTHLNSPGIRGSMSRYKQRTQIMTEQIAGDVTMHCGPTQLDVLLPLALGGTTGGGVTDVDDTLTEFDLIIDRVTKEMTYANCVVSRFSISASEGGPVEFTLGVEGETETVNSAGTTTFGNLDTDNIFIMSHCSITAQSSSRKFRNFNLTLTNILDTNRHLNSVTREEIPFLDRQVQLTVSAPYTSANSDLYDQAIAGAAGIVVLNNGTNTYTINIANMKAAAQSPTIPGKIEILLPVTFDCFHDGTDSEFKVTKT